MHLFLAAALFFMASSASAIGTGYVSDLLVYASYEDGDAIFKVTNPDSGCFGYALLAKTNGTATKGFRQVYATLLAASMNGKAISVRAVERKGATPPFAIWGGSGSAYCVVESLGPL